MKTLQIPRTYNPAQYELSLAYALGEPLFDVFAREAGVTSVDVRSVRQHPASFQFEVTTWNRRRIMVDADKIFELRRQRCATT